MSLLIGLSALRSSQTGLDVISQNITNAGTPGYHRQSVHFESLNEDSFRGRRIGSGVSVNDIERIRYQIIEGFLTETISEVGNVQQRLSVESQLEVLFLPGEGTLQSALDTLFNDIAGLGSAPGDNTSRNQVIQSGEQLANRFQGLAEQLQGFKSSLSTQIEDEINALNGEIEELSRLNQEIVVATSTGGPPNGLLDIRDELINQIAERVNVTKQDLPDGSVSLTFGNYSISTTITEIEFSLTETTDGQASVTFSGGQRQLQLSSGRLASLVESHNEVVPHYVEKLNELAATLIRNFDQEHATGVGSAGAFSRLVGNRAVDFPSLPLAQAGLAFPVESGNLHFSITDPSGNRRNEFISIDASTDSLEDLAAQIDSLENLNASIDPQTNQIQIVASSGYQFDFSRALAAEPELDSFSGSSIPSISGTYDGDSNSQFTFEIINDGAIGISENLTLRVSDANGNLVTDINIGNGYEAGTEIEVADGVSVTFPPGDVLAGDTFSVPLISNPDETGLLSALGLNSFFNGIDASTISVDQRISDSPELFSTSINGDAASSSKIAQFDALNRERLLSGETLTFSEFLVGVSTEIGTSVQATQRENTGLEALLSQHQQERDSVSGVDVNEEFVRLTQYQRSYEAAVRVIQTAESVLDELFQIIR